MNNYLTSASYIKNKTIALLSHQLAAVAEARQAGPPALPLHQFISKMYNRLTPTLYVHRGNSISSTHTAGSLCNSTTGQVHQLKQLQHINSAHWQLPFGAQLHKIIITSLTYTTTRFKIFLHRQPTPIRPVFVAALR